MEKRGRRCVPWKRPPKLKKSVAMAGITYFEEYRCFRGWEIGMLPPAMCVAATLNVWKL